MKAKNAPNMSVIKVFAQLSTESAYFLYKVIKLAEAREANFNAYLQKADRY